jgi:hypothetical protein
MLEWILAIMIGIGVTKICFVVCGSKSNSNRNRDLIASCLTIIVCTIGLIIITSGGKG